MTKKRYTEINKAINNRDKIVTVKWSVMGSFEYITEEIKGIMFKGTGVWVDDGEGYEELFPSDHINISTRIKGTK